MVYLFDDPCDPFYIDPTPGDQLNIIWRKLEEHPSVHAIDDPHDSLEPGARNQFLKLAFDSDRPITGNIACDTPEVSEFGFEDILADAVPDPTHVSEDEEYVFVREHWCF